MNSFVTPKGTKLNIIQIKGKDYLQVAQRIIWFREEKPEWGIETEFVELSENSATCKCVIKNEEGRIIVTAHKQEDQKGFFDFKEKAETGSIGRALALCGYGTQFALPDLDEGDRIVDSPIESKKETFTEKLLNKKQIPTEVKKEIPNKAKDAIEANKLLDKEIMSIKDEKKISNDDMKKYVMAFAKEKYSELNYQEKCMLRDSMKRMRV